MSEDVKALTAAMHLVVASPIVRLTQRDIPGASKPSILSRFIHLRTISLQRRWNGKNWDNSAVPQRCVERQIFPKADIWRLPDPHHRTTKIGPIAEWQVLDREIAMRSFAAKSFCVIGFLDAG
ncbi:hypothetical protein ACLN6N_07375 [Sphingomonas carotinifaciens]|uniref:hypothetical protein n=1 Tax=Sphingomonas carotinifaciens TaxID=1166323 RepID=UPI0039A29654